MSEKHNVHKVQDVFEIFGQILDSYFVEQSKEETS
jgi:hypothetical protein